MFDDFIMELFNDNILLGAKQTPQHDRLFICRSAEFLVNIGRH